MKKTVILLALTMVMLFGFCLQANAATETKFWIGSTDYALDGQIEQMDAAPFIDDNGRTLVPVRYLAKGLGIGGTALVWDADKQEVTLNFNSVKMVVPVGKPYYEFGTDNNMIKVLIGTSAVIKDGRIYLPARYVANEFMAKVTWSQADKAIVITRQVNDLAALMTYWRGDSDKPCDVLMSEDITRKEARPVIGGFRMDDNNLSVFTRWDRNGAYTGTYYDVYFYNKPFYTTPANPGLFQKYFTENFAGNAAEIMNCIDQNYNDIVSGKEVAVGQKYIIGNPDPVSATASGLAVYVEEDSDGKYVRVSIKFAKI